MDKLALARVAESVPVQSRSLEAALVAFLQSKASVSPIPVERRIFLTMAESAEFSGLPVVFLRRLIASGKLTAIKTGAGWRISRAAIEKLSGTLTEVPQELTEHELRDLEINRRRRQGN